jgi:hypothetical protein
MDIDEYSQQSMDDFNEEHPPHMWDLPDSDIESESTISVVKKNKFVEINTNDPGYFCVKDKIHGKKTRVVAYSSCLIPGVPIRNAMTGYFETDYMGKPTARVGTSDEDQFFKVTLAINGIGSATRTLFYDSVGQYERHFKTRVSQATTDIWNKKVAACPNPSSNNSNIVHY